MVVDPKRVGMLRGKLVHYTCTSLGQWMEKQNRYSTVIAEEKHAARHWTCGLGIFGIPLVRFIHLYIFRGGFLDGTPGLIVSLSSAFYTFLKHAKLWHLNHPAATTESDPCDRPRLTVALVSTQRRWHGGEEQARLLAVGLRQRGWRCVIFARRGGDFARRMTADGFETIAFAGGGRSPAALWQIRRALRRLRPDVLHYNDSHAMTAAGLAALGLHVPLRIAARRVDFPLRSPRPYRWFCDRVACVSQAVRQVCRAGGLPEAMLRVVHDGVDPARVRCRRSAPRAAIARSGQRPTAAALRRQADRP